MKWKTQGQNKRLRHELLLLGLIVIVAAVLSATLLTGSLGAYTVTGDDFGFYW